MTLEELIEDTKNNILFCNDEYYAEILKYLEEYKELKNETRKALKFQQSSNMNRHFEIKELEKELEVYKKELEVYKKALDRACDILCDTIGEELKELALQKAREE